MLKSSQLKIGKMEKDEPSGSLSPQCRCMEILNGFADQEKPLITPQSALEIAILVIADACNLGTIAMS